MTITDPFAPPVSEHVDTQLATGITNDPWAQSPPPPSVGAVTVDVKPNILPASEGKVVLTFKGGTGFDAPWIVIHAADLEDAHRQITEEAPLLADLMARVQIAGAHFAANGSTSSGRGGNTGAASNAPQGAAQAPAWAPPKPFDDFVYKTGISAKNGKVWHAWMPPEKGDSRDAKFFYPN